jgi:hypothetical protein
MNREEIIKDTLSTLQQLPDEKLGEVKDFAAFLLSRWDDRLLTEGISQVATVSKSYTFLADEEEVYSFNDAKEVYKN